ncbi:MAG: hypothetical protein HC875_24220 [Anaerolineales bacterium]|nr:hypothetical protein [Anaerolineales bacterium]
MSDDWLNQLRQLRERDKASRQPVEEVVDLSVLQAQRVQQAADLLRQADALNLLRQVQKALLDGKGILDVFEQTQRYDRAISLAWQGSISEARKPDPKSAEAYQYILIGVREGKLYVNDKEVVPASPEILKKALVEAARKPGRS